MSLAFLEDYLDTFESLPTELTKRLTQLRELDATCYQIMSQAKQETKEFLSKISALDTQERAQRLRSMAEQYKQCIQKGMEKVDLAVETFDTVDRHIQRLDDDLARFEEEQLTGPKVQQEKYFQVDKALDSPNKRKRLDEQEAQQRQQRQPQKKVIKPQVTRKEVKKDAMPVEFEVDPNEPTYCICKQISYGEMIACDNDDCLIEWFHYTCVGLDGPVKGKWFCPMCVDKMKKAV